MEEAPEHPEQVPLWSAALGGHPDWDALYRGYESAVDWPTAAFFPDLAGVYPLAKFVLTLRDAGIWAESFLETIYKLVSERGQAPAPMHPLLRMIDGVVRRTGFSEGLDAAALARAFVAHNEGGKATIPASRLLVCKVTEGWEPLCRFLGATVPRETPCSTTGFPAYAEPSAGAEPRCLCAVRAHNPRRSRCGRRQADGRSQGLLRKQTHRRKIPAIATVAPPMPACILKLRLHETDHLPQEI